MMHDYITKMKCQDQTISMEIRIFCKCRWRLKTETKIDSKLIFRYLKYHSGEST